MSEYSIGLNGEMIHCLDNSEYARFCKSKLEKELREVNEKEIENEN